MVCRLWRHCVLSLLLAAIGTGCAARSHHTAAIQNPYLHSSQAFYENGVEATRSERWQVAERAFEHALNMAQLADDTAQVTLVWYQLGVVRESMQKQEAAAQAYVHSYRLALRLHDREMAMRAQLALRLLHPVSSEVAQSPLPESLFTSRSWPLDIHLQAARLAWREGDRDRARGAWMVVTSASGASRAVLVLQARAHLGLARIAASEGDGAKSTAAAAQALKISHQVGLPRVAAQALLLSAPWQPPAGQVDMLERALVIYTTLQDPHGQQRCLERLLQLDGAVPHDQRSRYLLRLQALTANLGSDVQRRGE